MIFKKLHAGQRVCCTCAHYQQHYYRGKKQYREVYCGHCTGAKFKTRKARKPDQTCEFWTPIPSEKEETK